MRKNYVVVFLLALTVLLCFCACSRQNDSNTEKNDSSSPSSISEDSDKNQNLYENFIEKLTTNGLLPESIVDDMKDFRSEKNDDGSVLYIWSSWDKEKNDYIHNIQLVTVNNKIIDYKYKNYYFDDPIRNKPLTKKEAADLVSKFYRTFIQNDEDTVFENDPNKQITSVYDPGHVETWSAKSENGNYSIVVDFDLGGVTLFNAD